MLADVQVLRIRIKLLNLSPGQETSKALCHTVDFCQAHLEDPLLLKSPKGRALKICIRGLNRECRMAMM